MSGYRCEVQRLFRDAEGKPRVSLTKRHARESACDAIAWAEKHKGARVFALNTSVFNYWKCVWQYHNALPIEIAVGR